MKLRILLIAEESAGIQTLRLLASTSHTIVAVVAAPPRNSAAPVPKVWTVAESLGLPTWPAQVIKTAQFATRVEDEAVDLLLNVHSLYILPPEALRAVHIGAFNLHPGPLPRYAGLNAVSWAIYRGESVHGVTVHRMMPEVDVGPIAYQTLFPIQPTDTGLTVSARCTREGIVLLKRLLETASTSPDQIPAIPQDLSRREYFGKAVPEGGVLGWCRPARAIVDFVRACDFHPFPSPWGHPRALLEGVEVAVGKAALTGSRCEAAPGAIRWEGGSLHVASNDEWVKLEKLVSDGRLVDPAEVLNKHVRQDCSAVVTPP